MSIFAQFWVTLRHPLTRPAQGRPKPPQILVKTKAEALLGPKTQKTTQMGQKMTHFWVIFDPLPDFGQNGQI